MSDKINDGGPAFPFSAEYGHPAACGGMSLRDWFATEAMGLALSEVYSDQSGGFETAAARAYEFADAMLTERAKASPKEPDLDPGRPVPHHGSGPAEVFIPGKGPRHD